MSEKNSFSAGNFAENIKNWLLRHPFLVLGLFCLAGYSGSLANQFLLDDYLIIFNESGVSNKSFLDLFTSEQHIFYRPVGHIILWVCSWLFGHEVFFYHVVNLFLFLMVCWLFYYIINFLSGNRNLALLASLLYAVHPLNAGFVNYLTTSHISIFIITLQLSLILFFKYFDSGRGKLLWASLAFFILSLFSHELAIAAPAYILCFIYFLRRDRLGKSWPVIILYILVVLLFFIFRTLFFSLNSTGTVLKVAMSLGNVYLSSVMGLIYWYVGKLFVPTDILFLWTADVGKTYCSFEYLRLAGIIAGISYLLFMRWKKGLRAFALSIFIIGLIPTFAASYVHFPFADPFIEPHWFYFASFGFFILAADGILFLQSKMKNVRSWILPAGILFSLFVLLQGSNKNWKDQETYCRFWISKNPANATPFYGMGQVYLARGEYNQAIEFLEKAINRSYRYQQAFLTADLGYAYFLKGDDAAANINFGAAVKTEPEYSVSYYYLGLLAWRQGDKSAAEQYFLKAASLYPRRGLYRKELALVRSGQGPVGGYPLFNLQ